MSVPSSSTPAALPSDYDWTDNIADELDNIEESMAELHQLKRDLGHHQRSSWNVYWEQRLHPFPRGRMGGACEDQTVVEQDGLDLCGGWRTGVGGGAW